MMDYMLNLVEEQNAFSDNEMMEQLSTVIVAAYDPTSKSLTIALILIGSHPDVQTKIFQKLEEVFGKDLDRDIDTNGLSKLVYLEAVIKEILRLYSVVPRVARTCQSPVKLKNYTVPAGSVIGIILHQINRDPMWGADAEQFKPERWLDPASLPDNHNAFATFSMVKRYCIGKYYALITMKIYLANILRRYRVTGDINKLDAICDIATQ